ncbi:hypothetical protein IFM89_038925 [Coptis chinensis]|uniref:Uncharacterized protein n=1 Tax=Coptis chinensis TaxID=261450 RepID=A0A835M0Y5_9MAGN|nr:hypothetical protein IFM89_038925 [Coptis chinensis]
MKRRCIHRGGSNIYANSETQKAVMRMRNILDDVRVRSYAIKMFWINNEMDNLVEYYEKNFEGLTFLNCMEFLVEVLTKYINLDESDEDAVCPRLKMKSIQELYDEGTSSGWNVDAKKKKKYLAIKVVDRLSSWSASEIKWIGKGKVEAYMVVADLIVDIVKKH